jgi:hypothetical protein
LGTYFFDETKAREEILRILPIMPSLSCQYGSVLTNYAPGMMAYYSQCYKFWRGGIKVQITFNCSLFTSATLRITHNTYNEATTDMETVAGNKVSEIVEIRGTTKWKKTIPYIGLNPWTPVVGFRTPALPSELIDVFPTALEITVLNPATSTADAGDATIYYSIYVGAADDIDFKDFIGFSPRAAQVEYVPPEKQSLRADFATDFMPMHPAIKAMEAGYVKTENETNLIELLHREAVVEPSYALDHPTLPYTHPSVENVFERLLYPFIAFRGSTNIRVVSGALKSYLVMRPGFVSFPYNSSSWSTGKLYLQSPNYILGEDVSSSILPGDLAVNIPHSSAVPVVAPYSTLTEDNSLYEPTLNVFNSGEDKTIYQSLGDDFMCGTPLNPPTFNIEGPLSKPAPPPQTSPCYRTW